MYRNELRERAALLLRLGHSQERVKKRLLANVAWDFEMNGTPRHEQTIDKIVNEVFARRGVGAGAPTP
jgi:hypothetical protein